VVSERVTNVLRHAGGVTRFRLVPAPGTVSVSVEDSNRRVPRLLPPDVERPGRVGWHLVRTLCANVQVRIRPGEKTVPQSCRCPTDRRLPQGRQRPASGPQTDPGRTVRIGTSNRALIRQVAGDYCGLRRAVGRKGNGYRLTPGSERSVRDSERD
jgi:hypothetical protein